MLLFSLLIIHTDDRELTELQNLQLKHTRLTFSVRTEEPQSTPNSRRTYTRIIKEFPFKNIKVGAETKLQHYKHFNSVNVYSSQ